ncbi:MAG: T9SS type A sorting domain-containing protein [Melioribacteraceae bacterium]|nr:T9SS type A sorting domain-containing protein [Melioribacteraceae bacterium]MCF8356498.1 T9SS type A sorting domain-containing protein [Melioribacteraceae bacterium]MCF8395886.1 T9SS type A sorting domain-containing protein [Melioribacteraceae bacterium]MCF8420951.1 T9SS type A sorting domain-containing protein [Melioribacteraceae bacterium]
MDNWEQTVPPWDEAGIIRNVEQGVYVIRRDGIKDQYHPARWLQCVPADGRYDWEVNQSVDNPWGSGELPVFKQLDQNYVTGYHDLEFIPFSYGSLLSPQTINFTEDENGNPQLDIRQYGDGSDAFRIGFNEVFSPWSNPNNQMKNRNTTGFGFYIKSFSNGNYTLDLYVGTAFEAPPSIPQNLKVSWYNNHPKLTWDSNGEPDMQSYKIWKYVEGSSMIAATVNHDTSLSTHQWIDNYVDKPGKFDPVYDIRYKVKARDNSSKESLYSEQVSIDGTTEYLWKNSNIDENNKSPKNYSLGNNYPNPFNPSTSIDYAIPKSGHVILNVVNILGETVMSLVNRNQEAGYYTVNFNSANLASGVYFYKIQAGNYTSVKKMLLIK